MINILRRIFRRNTRTLAQVETDMIAHTNRMLGL